MPQSPRLRDTGNRLLDRLPDDEFGPLEPQLQRVTLAIKQVVQQFEAEIVHIYFPAAALVSLLTVLREDDPVEAATVGSEGIVNVTAALGVELAQHRAICQMPGDSYRLPAHRFREAIARGAGLKRLVDRYIVYSLRRSNQAIACNLLHNVNARACRWLLVIHDQAGQDQFPMTQEFLAFMLGVRRQTVTVVAGTLQNAGLISYHRGTITVRNRPQLEEAACECYAEIREYYDHIVV